MRKKILITGIIVIGVMASVLTGCKKDGGADTVTEEVVEKNTEENEVTEETEAEADNSEMEEYIGNPMVEIDDDAKIADMSYGLVIPYGVDYESIESYVIADSLLERRFTLDNVDFTARIEKADSYEDISGMYYDWTVTDEVSINSSCKGTCARYIGDDETVDLVTWYDVKNGANYSICAVAKDLDGFDIMAYVAAMYGEGNKMDALPGSIPGVPEEEQLEEALNSFITWAGLQYFYNGMQFDELNDDIAIAMSAFAAQNNNPDDFQLSEDGVGQIMSSDKIAETSLDLFGKVFDTSKADANVMMQSHLAVMDDGSIDIALGDWGLVVPMLEINAVDKVSPTNEEFYINARYYAFSYEDDQEVDSIPSYVCRFICVPNDNSRYGFNIVEMAASIVE